MDLQNLSEGSLLTCAYGEANVEQKIIINGSKKNKLIVVCIYIDNAYWLIIGISILLVETH
jgi:hypothetical protein